MMSALTVGMVALLAIVSAQQDINYLDIDECASALQFTYISSSKQLQMVCPVLLAVSPNEWGRLVCGVEWGV